MEVKEKLRLDVALPDVTPFENHDDYDNDFEEEEEDLDLGSPQSLSNYTLDETWSDEDKLSVSTQQTSSTRLQSQSMISLPKDSAYYPYHLAFGRTKVMEIDRENKRLGKALRKNYEAQKPALHQPSKVRPTSSVNRRREQERIARENEQLLKRLRSAKSSKDIERTEHDKFYARHRVLSANSSRTHRKLGATKQWNSPGLFRSNSKPDWDNKF